MTETQPDLSETILQITREKKPETVDQLARQVEELHPASKQEILDTIIKLQNEGRLKLTRQPQPAPPNLSAYLKTFNSAWYWITLGLTLATVVAIFTIPGDSYPLVYIRQTLGAIFVLWLPGYAFIKALFPQNLPFAHALARSLDTSEKNLDTIERIALSLGMSIALVPIVGLLLNYTPWGIRLTPIVLSLLALTTIFATAGIIREHRARVGKTRTV